MEDIEPVEQVAPECAGGDGLLQVAICGRNHADVHRNRPFAADTFQFTLLENAQ